MYKYAQLNESGIVAGVSYLTGEVDAPNMILLDGLQNDEIGIGWRFIDGAWHEPEPAPEDELEDGRADENTVTQEDIKKNQMIIMGLLLETIEMIEGGAADE